MRMFASIKVCKNINIMKIDKDLYELQRACGEAMLIPRDTEDIDNKEIISLDPISEYLWENISDTENFTIETMVSLLTREYDVDEDTAREDCLLIVEAWQEMGIITE